MKILVTGTAGFIGFSTALELLRRGNEVVGVDNHNDYYDIQLKEDRVAELSQFKNYQHHRIDISHDSLKEIAESFLPETIVNLAAQAGVQYSLKNPKAYVEANIMGFMNILEISKEINIKHLVYASSSSVYGANTSMPFSEDIAACHPLSIYASSKRANELMAHTFSYIHRLPSTGLRFFTVYGPWGRPDMALFKFTKSILNNDPIDVYNNGEHSRDFTYIDDIVQGIISAIDKPPLEDEGWSGKDPNPSTSFCPFKIYNIGNGSPVKLMKFIELIEKELGKKAEINFLPLQIGDVPETHADISSITRDLNYSPSTSTDLGIKKFIEWYKDYYKV